MFHRIGRLSALVLLMTGLLTTGSVSGDDFDAAQLAVEFTRARERNLEIFHMYEWKTRTEVVLEDSSKAIELQKVHFTEDGERSRKLIGGSAMGSDPRTKRLVPAVRELVEQYTEPSAGALVDFFARAKFAPGSRNGTVRVFGKDFLEEGDVVVVLFDLETKRPVGYRFRSTLDGSRIEGNVDVGTHPEGFVYVEQISVKMPAKKVVAEIRNFDLVNRTPAEALKIEGGPAVEGEAEEDGWPREYSGDGGRLVVYQPQLDSWEKYRKLRATAAFSLERDGAEPVFGAATLSALTETDFSKRTVWIKKRKIEQMTLGDLDEAEQKKAKSLFRELFPNEPIPHSLDRLVAAVEIDKTGAKNAEIDFEPPRILVSDEPAVLLTVVGEPLMEAVPETDLKQVLNTSWSLLQQDGSLYYLRVGDRWLQSSSLQEGWAPCEKLPASFDKIPTEPRWAALKGEGESSGGKDSSGEVPGVVFSADPAELIVTDGEPRFQPIAGTRLLAITNSDSDLFLNLKDSRYYFLVAGRWFRSKSLEGPWTFATPDLPADFSKISPDHERGDVLASVPGTPAAKEAWILAQVPRTATVERHSPEVEVTYEGDPEFVEIPDTALRYAVNTAYDVIAASDGQFYLCHEGIWFVSASATGPWSVCIEVPDEIYDIPSTSPKYHVTFVKVYDHDDDSVTSGYTGGYYGLYRDDYYDDDVIYYGTGYYYRYPYRYWRHRWRYRARHSRYPRYAHHHGTYGYGARYSTRRAGFNAGRRYSRYHTGTRFGGGAYSAWGGKGVRANHQVTTRQTRGRVVANSPRNVYAGRDGHVYRKHNGRWQQRGGAGWADVGRSGKAPARASRTSATGKAGAKRGTTRAGSQRDVRAQLKRDSRTRQAGTQRHSQRSTQRSTYRGRGGYGGYGGGRRGGGGGRRR